MSDCGTAPKAMNATSLSACCTPIPFSLIMLWHSGNFRNFWLGLLAVGLIICCGPGKEGTPKVNTSAAWVENWVKSWPSLNKETRQAAKRSAPYRVKVDIGNGLVFASDQSVTPTDTKKSIIIDLPHFTLTFYPPVVVDSGDWRTQREAWKLICNVPTLLKGRQTVSDDRDDHAFVEAFNRRIAAVPAAASVTVDSTNDPSIVCVTEGNKIEGTWWPLNSQQCVYFAASLKGQSSVDELIQALVASSAIDNSQFGTEGSNAGRATGGGANLDKTSTPKPPTNP